MMNLLENQPPPQVFLDSNLSAFIQAAKEQSGFALPDALVTPRYGAIPQRQRTAGSYPNYPAFQPFEPFVEYEQSVPRISIRIAEAVQSSRRILELPENWDEEGSPVYSYETWERATRFVLQSAMGQRRDSGVWVGPPKITPGPDGSIDVRWKTSTRSVLINFPHSDHERVQFFGSDGDVETVKGTLDLTSPNQWILVWLMR